MQTFECPKCGAPVTYDPSVATSAHCPYCQSQLAVPNEMRGEPARVIPRIDLNIGPQVVATACRLTRLTISADQLFALRAQCGQDVRAPS